MKKRLRLILAVVLICGVSIVIYAFWNYHPPADPHADRIAFRMASSFPGSSGVFISYDIYVMNVDKPGLTHIVRGVGSAEDIAWSPTGDRIVHNQGGKGLYIVNADGTGEPDLLWSSSNGRPTLVPDWSPDNSKMVFWQGALYILDIRTGKSSVLINEPMVAVEPDWSPDGNKIAFTYQSPSSTNLTTSSIAVINSDGSKLTELTPTNGSSSPDWSPDGSQIVFDREGNIYVMNADGTNTKALIRDGKSLSPTWSPDGKRIAFISMANRKCTVFITLIFEFCNTELRVMNADGSDVVILKGETNENIIHPVWAPRK